MFFNLLKNKNFTTLWSSQTLAQLEATIVDFTVIVIIDEAVKTGHFFTASAVALVFALQFIPALPAALISGIISDVIDRRKLLIFFNLFRSVFLLIFVFAPDPGPHLFVFVLVMAVCMHMYDVIEKATLRNVAGDSEIGLANGLFLFTLNATTLIGVIAAGFLKNAFQPVLISGAILYAVAAYLAFRLPKDINNFHVDHYEPDQNALVDVSRSVSSVLKNIKESLKYLLTIPPIYMGVILATLVQTIMLLVASVSFRYGDEILGLDQAGVSIFLLVPVAVGLALGGTFTPLFTKMFSYRRVVFFSWLASSLLLIVLGGVGFVTRSLRPSFTFEFIFLEVLLVILGLFVTLIQAPALELIQRFVDPKKRGRVFGILVGMTNTIAGILVACSGFIIDALRSGKGDMLGTSKFFLFIGLILLLTMGFFQVLTRKVLGDKDFTEYEAPQSIPTSTDPSVLTPVKDTPEV